MRVMFLRRTKLIAEKIKIKTRLKLINAELRKLEIQLDEDDT